MRLEFFASLFLFSWLAQSQEGTLSGSIIDKSTRQPLIGATLQADSRILGVTDSLGFFQFPVAPGIYEIELRHIGYKTKTSRVNINPGTVVDLTFVLKAEPTLLEGLEIIEKGEADINHNQEVEAQAARDLPSAFGDFTRALVTLPGVTSNNELSSRYSVRGGSFAENLVYINEIPVYRPFLSVAGQQEGLSVVHPDMVADINFFPGGWGSRYGDKLSSSLNIQYRRPNESGGRLNIGLLGGSGQYQTRLSDRMAINVGVRHRDSRYLLNSLEVAGEYFPTYSDAQALWSVDLTSKETEKRNRTLLQWLTYYGRNRYLTFPESQTTVFGSIAQNFRIETSFAGREALNYDTYQSGVNLSHLWNNRWLSRWIASVAYTNEREYYEVEGAYRLCDVDQGGGIEDCEVVRGVGTNYRYGRNRLVGLLATAEFQNEWLLSDQQALEWGVGMHFRQFDDQVNEYAFADSVGFVDLQQSVFNSLDLRTRNVFTYISHEVFARDSVHAFKWGVRLNHWNYNNQLLVSPRMTYQWIPGLNRKTVFKLSAGWYQQFPLYRELRTFNGDIRENARAQRSIHFIAGFKRTFSWWRRPFIIQTDIYYKWLYDLIPYDIDNVRIRYFDQNNAFGYATGLDFRVNGEFIAGTQSWLSLSLLNTKENVAGDNAGYVRRPTDQRLNLAILFQDHVPNDPSLRVYLNLVFGSGFPVGPPNNLTNRNAFQGDEYYRTDIGLSKVIKGKGYIRQWELRAEVLNALGADNTLSYNWIEDVNGDNFAIPNALSARFLNLRILTIF